MQKASAILALLTLASCSSALRRGKEEYHEGMYDLNRDPSHARVHFERSDGFLAEVLAEGDLEPAQKVTALAVRVRSLIELDRHADAAKLLEETKVEGFDPEYRYEGDKTGLALVKAHHVDPDRAFTELVLAERGARTARARLHLAWQQVKFLRKVGTTKARMEAIQVCQKNAGKLDFDEQKKALAQ